MVDMLWELNIVKVDNTLISTIELLFYETDLAKLHLKTADYPSFRQLNVSTQWHCRSRHCSIGVAR